MNNNTEQYKINLSCIIRDVFRDIWVAIVVGISFALLAYVIVNYTYSPKYTSRTTFVVSAKGSTTGPYGDITKIQKLADVIESVMDSQVLKRLVSDRLEMDSFPGTVEIAVVPETNLLTVSITSDTPDVAFRLLNTLLECYPTVGEQVLGEIVLEIFEKPTFPSVPNKTISSKRVMLYGFAIGMALIVVVFATLSYLKNTVKGREDIEEKLDTKEITTLYHERKYRNLRDRLRGKQKALLLTDPTVGFGYAEAIKKIRTKLLYQMKKKDIKVILVTSTLHGEGKTTVALNIAEAMAQRFEHVLLIEGDTRQKKSAYAMKNYKFQVLRCDSDNRIDSELLESPKMKELLRELREKMDVIIIDGPPVQKRSDAELWARVSDASVLVVKQNQAEAKYINDTIDMLDAYGEGLIGCIFNDVVSAREILSSGYGYGYGYGYGRYGKYGKYGKY